MVHICSLHQGVCYNWVFFKEYFNNYIFVNLNTILWQVSLVWCSQSSMHHYNLHIISSSMHNCSTQKVWRKLHLWILPWKRFDLESSCWQVLCSRCTPPWNLQRCWQWCHFETKGNWNVLVKVSKVDKKTLKI